MSKLSALLANKYLSLSKDTHLKLLEEPLVFKTTTDELYRVDETTFGFLKRCDGTSKVAELNPEPDFLQFCRDEELFELLEKSRKREKIIGYGDDPSLRYLLINITDRCNLKCRHCYLGEAGSSDISLSLIHKTMDEFEEMGGLRLIVSGGEPLLHPHFSKINEIIKDRTFRSILITNGTLFQRFPVDELNFNEVQVSLDGLEQGHESLRGKGTFKKTLAGIDLLKKTGGDVSVATMAHAFNLREFDELEELVRAKGAVSWTIDIPTLTGRLKEHPEIMPNPDAIGRILEYQYGAEIHSSEENYACGAHLACLNQDELLSKCGFYGKEWGVYIEENLQKAWRKLPKMHLSSLAETCRKCEYLDDCHGGCRYRAEVYDERSAPDPVKCAALGVKIFEKMLLK